MEQRKECEEVRTLLRNLAPNLEEIGDEKAGKHLEECPECRAYLEKMRSLDKMLGLWEAPKPEGNLQARVMAGIAQIEKDRSKGILAPFRSLVQFRFRVPAYAFVLLILLFAFSVAVNVAVMLGSSKNRQIARGKNERGVDIRNVVGEGRDIASQTPIVIRDDTVFHTGAGDRTGNYLESVPGATVQPALVVIMGMPPTGLGTVSSTVEKGSSYLDDKGESL